jgi:lytic murein transglycosylase
MASAGTRTTPLGPRRRKGPRTSLAALYRVSTIFAAAMAIPASAESFAPKSPPEFEQFVSDLWPLAETRGISRKTFDAAFKGVTFDSRVIARTSTQAEFVMPIWQYLAGSVSRARIDRGRAKRDAERIWLAKAESEYGVDEAIVMGVWGMETEFGAFEGSDYVIRSLASLAYIRYQGEYCRDELASALSILQEGAIAPREMVGSWAGAMGQTQFMPSSFLAYAVDFDGGGRRDIWTNSADAIGSIANYLAKRGWKKGLPWGFEVRLPAGFKLAREDSSSHAPFAAFASRGVSRADGLAMPSEGEAQLLLPAGLAGPIFLVTSNFYVIKSYNNSTSYALGVALLGDAIARRKELHASWPTRDRILTPAQIRELQTALQELGYEVGKIDGLVGENLQAAVSAYQAKMGLAPDGYPSAHVLRMMKSRR